MNSFIIDCTAMALIGQRVGKVLEKVEKTSGQFAKTPCSAYGDCGCGVGGTCADSCVSGCAERGGCGPHGPR